MPPLILRNRPGAAGGPHASTASTGAITGTPTATSGATTYTVTVTDANSAAATNTFSLSVNPQRHRDAGRVDIQNSVTANTTAISFTPVTGSGGTAPRTFTRSHRHLPAGLSLDTSRPAQISGYADGATSGADDLSRSRSRMPTARRRATTFSLTVNGADRRRRTNVPSSALPINQAVTPFTPVDRLRRHRHADLRAWLASLADRASASTPRNGLVSGTPTVARRLTTTYTVTVYRYRTPHRRARRSACPSDSSARMWR